MFVSNVLQNVLYVRDTGLKTTTVVAAKVTADRKRADRSAINVDVQVSQLACHCCMVVSFRIATGNHPRIFSQL